MILAQANLIPPFVCRLIARKRVMTHRRAHWEPLSHSDIAAASGLPRSTVADLSGKDTWHGVAIETIDRFATACGVNLARPGQHLAALRRRSRLGHLAQGNAQQRRFFKRLFASAQRHVE